MLEKERKFLFTGDLNELFSEPYNIRHKIEQGYLMLDEGQQLRVRIIDNIHCSLCYKYDISPRVKNEFEYSINNPKEGRKLFERAKYKLTKDRYTIFRDDDTVFIDIYPDGLKVVEIEYRTKLTDIPDYCGKEITGEKEYSNIAIAIKNGDK